MTVMADENKNIEQLKKCDTKLCTNVLHRLVDGICHRARPSYEDFSKVWSLTEWWDVSDALTELMKNAVKETWTKDQLFEQLKGLGDEYNSLVYDVISSRSGDIRSQLLADSHTISQAVLADFDWKLKLMMSSDKIATVQEPVVSLDLDVQTNSGARNTVAVELSREDLNNLITSLEAANKALVHLKS